MNQTAQRVSRLNALSVNRQSWLLAGLSALVWLLRRPGELLVGYFYAEEGATYFHYAWNSTALNALLAPHQGYYSLFPNAAMLVAARVLPVSFAAAFGAWCGLAVVLLAVYLVAQCELFTNFVQRALAVTVCMLAAPDLTVTLSTINSQYYFAVCAAVVLVSSHQRLGILRVATLLAAGLTGVVSCFFTPFYCIRAVKTRSPRLALESAVLVVCTALQLTVVWRMTHIEARNIHQHHPVSVLLDSLFVNTALMEFSSRLTWYFTGHLMVTHHSLVLWDGFALLSLFALAALARLLWSGGEEARWLTSMAFSCGLLSLIGALGSDNDYIRGSERYLLVTNMLVGLALVVTVFRHSRKPGATLIPALLVVALLVSGLVDVPFYWRMVRHEVSWPREIAQWKNNDHIALKMAPANWAGAALVISHQPAEQPGLPSYIYDSVGLRASRPRRQLP